MGFAKMNMNILNNNLKIQDYSSITIDRPPQVYELEYLTTNNYFQIYQKLLLFHWTPILQLLDEKHPLIDQLLLQGFRL